MSGKGSVTTKRMEGDGLEAMGRPEGAVESDKESWGVMTSSVRLACDSE